MKHDARFDLKLPAAQRRELAELAIESGLSSADLVRLCVRWLLAHPDRLLRPGLPVSDPPGMEARR
jgi:hypothetical protein